jgi:acyl-CoA synthetase (AMP-forming)/AMP-acid ligase II
VDQRFWAEWSRGGWRRHLPDVPDPQRFAHDLGNATIHGLAHATATTNPDRLAIRIGDTELTHGGLDHMAARAAGWLSRRVKPGERVLIAAPVSAEWLAAYLGTLRTGAIAVLANPTYTSSELEQIRESSQPALELTEFNREMLAGDPAPWAERSTPDETALLAFTSGTTGRPKGVPLTHRHVLTSIRAAMAAWRWKPHDVLIHALPLFHLHGLNGVHATLIAGSRLHLITRFDAETLPGEIANSRASILFAVPTMYQRLAPGSAPLTRLRLCVSGSAQLGHDAAQNALRALGQVPLIRYGTSETGLDVSHVYSDRRELARVHTVGLPLPGVEARLGEDDEIQVRGPQVFSGYWRDEVATTAAFTEDGWFRTGDIGRIDHETSELMVDGRLKEVIITGGLKVSPREVELALEQHPTVAEAAVAGVASERWGEEVTAWVVLKPDARFSERALIEHARTLLAPYKSPKQIYAVDALPRNPLGKIDRKKLLPA